MNKSFLVVGLLGIAATTANAGSSTSNMGVTATVVASCTVTAGTLAFPNYDAVTGAQVDGSGTLSVACSKGAITSITLGQGANAGFGSTDLLPLRRMKKIASTETLSYSLYQDATRLVTWGNTALTGVTYVPASAAATNVNVYGRITAGQDQPTGSYSDTVLATISF